MPSTIKVNLLLREYAPPRQAGALEWGMAAAAAAVLVGAGLYYMGVSADAARMADQAANREQRLHMVRAQLAEAAVIRQREQRVAQAEGDLKGLVGRHWSNVLLSLRDVTPQHVTWQALTIDQDTLTLKATSRGLVDVAQLFGGLIVHPQVSEVSLRYVNEAGIQVTYKAEPGTGKPLPQEQIRPAGEFTQLDFEIVIILVPQEGGLPHGA